MTSRKRAAVAMTALLLISACAIDRNNVEPDEPALVDLRGPQVEPTAVPAPPPTPALVEPTPTPPPVVEPEATATPPAATPTPGADNSATPVVIEAGEFVAGDISFVLSQDRLVAMLPGHTLIYLDDDQQAEVDVFSPIADPAGMVFADYQAVIAFIEIHPSLAGLEELAPVTIAGQPTRVFSGTGTSEDRSFYTSVDSIKPDEFGWYAPARMQLWVIDTPNGTVIVSAEALTDPGQFADAVGLATETLSTIEFG